MDEATSKVFRRSSILAQALALAAASVSAAPPQEWSAAPFESARQQARPLAVLVTDGAHAAAESAWRADPVVAARLSGDFVEVRVDRALRPDVAELLGMAVRERTGFDGLPLLAALSSDGRPLFGLTGARALDPAEMPGFAETALAMTRAGAKPDERSSAALDAVRAAQRPSPALRPLDLATVEATTRAAIAAPQLGRTDGPFPHAAIGLLLAEYQRARVPEVLRLATTALDLRLARPGDAAEAPVAEQAEALATWARAHDVAGRAAYGDEAARRAALLRRLRREDGCLPESAADGRVIAQTNGLAVGALALTGRVAGRPADVDAARAAAACVLASLGPAGALSRGSGAPAGSAFLDDHAALVAGLLELYDATGEARWRTEAQAVADAALGRFLDVEGGGFFLTDAAHEPALARLKHAFDGALPSANGTMAQALLQPVARDRRAALRDARPSHGRRVPGRSPAGAARAADARRGCGRARRPGRDPRRAGRGPGDRHPWLGHAARTRPARAGPRGWPRRAGGRADGRGRRLRGRARRFGAGPGGLRRQRALRGLARSDAAVPARAGAHVRVEPRSDRRLRGEDGGAGLGRPRERPPAGSPAAPGARAVPAVRRIGLPSAGRGRAGGPGDGGGRPLTPGRPGG
jgi:hypothetical protein